MKYIGVGERADALIGRLIYLKGIGFGRVILCQLVWSNYARLTLKKSDGTLVSTRFPVTI